MQHDSGAYCTPYSASPSDANGNFIMFASATSGDRPNNSQFSPCSKDNITAVLDKVVTQKNGKVFRLLEYFHYCFIILSFHVPDIFNTIYFYCTICRKTASRRGKQRFVEIASLKKMNSVTVDSRRIVKTNVAMEKVMKRSVSEHRMPCAGMITFANKYKTVYLRVQTD